MVKAECNELDTEVMQEKDCIVVIVRNKWNNVEHRYLLSKPQAQCLAQMINRLIKDEDTLDVKDSNVNVNPELLEKGK